jgi:hypothetical protein
VINYIHSAVYLGAMAVFDIVSTIFAIKVEWQIEDRKAHKMLAQKLLSEKEKES